MSEAGRQVIPEAVMLARLAQSEQMREFFIEMWKQNPTLAKQGGAKVAQLLSEAPMPASGGGVAQARNPQRGISLVELIFFIVIISVALTGILLVMNVVARGSADPLIHKQALAIAESLLEEVELKPFTFCDPDDGSAATAAAPAGCGAVAPIVGAEVIGVENDVSRTDAALPFDNVSDYDGFNMAAGSVLDIAGGAVVAGYATAITVAPSAFGVIPAAESLLITVTVTGPGGASVVLQGYRMRYAPNAVP